MTIGQTVAMERAMAAAATNASARLVGAEPATQLYVGHRGRLTALVPAGWMVDPSGRHDLAGEDGFVVCEPLAGETLDEASNALVASGRFDNGAAVAVATCGGKPARRVAGRVAGGDAVGLVVAHPRPFEVWSETFAFAAVVVDQVHADSILATVDLSPERVTPTAFVSSVVDIVEARAYWADGVEWPRARAEFTASAEQLAALEEVQQALPVVLEELRAVGDNHSFLLPPGGDQAFRTSVGLGLLVGGRRILAVYPDGPAARAGVQVGDVVETVDGHFPIPTSVPSDRVAQ